MSKSSLYHLHQYLHLKGKEEGAFANGTGTLVSVRRDETSWGWRSGNTIYLF